MLVDVGIAAQFGRVDGTSGDGEVVVLADCRRRIGRSQPEHLKVDAQLTRADVVADWS